MLHVARLKRHNFGKGHAYTLDCDCPGRYRKTDPHKTYGVTTALSVLAKPALTGWAGRITAEYALDHWDELTEMPPSQRLDTLRSVQYNTKSKAATKGNELHEIAAKIAAGQHVFVPDEDRHQAQLLADWMDREQFTSWASEAPCVNTEHGYAGTLDNAGVLGRRGERVLIDFKRTGGIYEEVVYQTAAYRFTDLWQPDGPASEEATPTFDACYAVHIKPDAIEMRPLEADESAFEEFLYILTVARDYYAAQDNSRIGAPLPPLELEES